MRIGATPYFPPQTTFQAARAPAGSTDDNQQASGQGLDFTSTSRSSLRDTVNSLIKSGKLSLDDSSGLVGMMGPAATTYAGNGGPSAATYDSSPFDALSALRTAIDGANSRHDDKSAAVFSRTLSALQQLQGTVAGLDLKA
ncbi:hypothetical protein AH2_00038 [Burkholderia phage vB_BceS_AH2]|uniref:Uncharacterized protein n=1 Tax=Burkholderia phage vB_BceS_AH2 TaxID=1133022 RepID=I6NP90_9CAUD|nr:hypothetical protein B613_gp38 [Burkholderia phage vB_BceS_AH2]AEY69548.1 hypothetical protein AH2_00038 [Burkholderia phage vB_BceS_AH2]